MMMWDKKSTYIIIPTFNEASVIRQIISSLNGIGYSLVVVDDASTDDLENVISGAQVNYIRHRINLGQGAAIQTGISYAVSKQAEYFVTFDADGQHDPHDIERMINFLVEKDLDILFGSRFLPGANTKIKPTRRITLQLGRYVNYVFSGILLTDAHNGLRVFNRKTATTIELKENRMAHASEFLWQVRKHDLKFAEFPVRVHYTAYSSKKGQSLLNSVRIFFELVLNKLFD